MKIHPLPPLNSLVAFEAAARHLSFTLAAQELNVTQGAISRQVRLLEDYLGKVLFERTTRTIQLSPAASQYYETVRASLMQVAQATGEIRHWQGAEQVTVATSTAMASLWLLPKVTEFQRENEEIDLRIIAHDQVKDFSRLDCDLALYYCSTPPRDMQVTPLFSEEVYPVCSPAYQAKYPALTEAKDLAACTWLVLDDSQRDWIGWFDWLQSQGLKGLEPKRRININSYSMVIQSAINGQGIALAWSNLVDDYLNSGALVRPLDAVLRTDAQFCLLEPLTRGGMRQSVRRFRSWLMNQLPATPDKN
ncbi:MAG: LysR substrate-binding domain-containing protein [Pseudomonas sp.]|jgi:LysR family glycine cleavage system transcriptional activator|uniref:LysR substrate-binding domain-containing protein n=1 Tax=Pseudomonas sp. TaxID=306 RepID=UPI00238AF40B|nr:LysR substrate-binding domain-containing protein [Pseudomonas sp.]MDP9031650.1 LysR substrate-binding domain-containing protein [Pseudomonadota bacterium]MDE1912462.1 LysR family transcriptional regulator [Pseudomonas sp.]MDE2194967.1 LysR family transcriptional regulator [Pseudomonas sp.]MDP9060212.1 LysR substrate-binding domain-containing protein [Pseudomonadota bacterium]MDP9215574.1 LysR substrate-binding domain-containing protein [Pseudomonadota bacterium]